MQSSEKVNESFRWFLLHCSDVSECLPVFCAELAGGVKNLAVKESVYPKTQASGQPMHMGSGTQGTFDFRAAERHGNAHRLKRRAIEITAKALSGKRVFWCETFCQTRCDPGLLRAPGECRGLFVELKELRAAALLSSCIDHQTA